MIKILDVGGIHKVGGLNPTYVSNFINENVVDYNKRTQIIRIDKLKDYRSIANSNNRKYTATTTSTDCQINIGN